jgi:hypothetical protein
MLDADALRRSANRSGDCCRGLDVGQVSAGCHSKLTHADRLSPTPSGYPALRAGRGGIASGGRDGAGSGVALDGAAALAIGADVKMVKVLKVLNF